VQTSSKTKKPLAGLMSVCDFLGSTSPLAILATGLRSLAGWGSPQNFGGYLLPLIGGLYVNPAVKMDAHHNDAISARDFNFSHCHNSLHRHYDTERVMKTTNGTTFFTTSHGCFAVYNTVGVVPHFIIINKRASATQSSRSRFKMLLAKRNMSVVSNSLSSAYNRFRIKANRVKTHRDFVACSAGTTQTQTREMNIALRAMENMPRQAFIKHGFVVAVTDIQLCFHGLFSLFVDRQDYKPDVGLLSRVNRELVYV
jgi:hypothetical protein